MMENTPLPRFVAVVTAEQINHVAELAQQIWMEYYPPITGSGQTQYMLAHYQSPAAITQQLQQGYHYFLVQQAAVAVGYFALVFPVASPEVQLSKIYLHAAARRQGYGAAIIRFVEQWTKEHGATAVWLTVNRNNHTALNFYQAQGFQPTGPLVQDIGNGYVMDDYRMAKVL